MKLFFSFNEKNGITILTFFHIQIGIKQFITSNEQFPDMENEELIISSDDEEVQLLSLDYDLETRAEKIEIKYSSQIIQNFVEKINDLNSLRLVGEWNLFNMLFKEMELEDCKSFSAFLKINGFFEDVKLI